MSETVEETSKIEEEQQQATGSTTTTTAGKNAVAPKSPQLHRVGECHMTTECIFQFVVQTKNLFRVNFAVPFLYSPAPNTIYRRAILQALEYSSLQNFNSRSNIDAIRRHTKEIIADHDDPEAWNDTLFLQTLKSVVNQGDVELLANIQAELSPTYKRKRAHSWQKKLEAQQQEAPPQLPIMMGPPATLPVAEPHHVVIAFKDPKEPPHRPREHEKWKILPKRIHDRTT